MAIYHCEMQNISRSDGRSIVACAAYRAGEKLYCDTYGKEQDYTKKTGIEYTQIFAPVGASPDLLDRQTLWNQVEQSELKKDGSIKQEARLAKEVEVALPHELDKAQRQALVTELCQSLVKSYGVAVDAAIHAPHVHGGSDHRNFHAHILMTTRTATPQGLGKKVRELDRHSTLKKIREEVADLTNRHLAAAGLDLAVDHRSHKDRGLDIEPTFKEGLEATHAKRRGEELEIVKRNDEIKKRNKKAERLDMSIIETSNRVEQLTLEQQQQQQLEDAVDQAPAVYATAQQALYDHQQHRQTLIDVYLIEVKTDEKRAEHRFYKALQDNIDRLQLDKVIKEGRAATALLREIGEPLPPPVKVKTGWFSADYYGFEDMLKQYETDQSSLAVYHAEIREEMQAQQQKERERQQEAKRKEEDREKQKQAYERYLSKYGYVKDAEYDHVSDSVGWELSTYTRLQAQAWARNDMQEYARCSKEKYEQISDKIKYERDLKTIELVSYILDKDRQAIANTLPQLKPYYEQMQQTVNKRKITIEDERQPSFKPSYYEQPQQKKDKDNDLTF
ncbi:MobQ family relaxase [Acinetobacter ursingii]|uniref:MobQ family relaxase n=1 Tax=Acinetobacter ursingii TaxID=108980 RepID=UPI00148E3FBC|nr:MobQ family relaxase [Acinetobacter ursingii]